MLADNQEAPVSAIIDGGIGGWLLSFLNTPRYSYVLSIRHFDILKSMPKNVYVVIFSLLLQLTRPNKGSLN